MVSLFTFTICTVTYYRFLLCVSDDLSSYKASAACCRFLSVTFITSKAASSAMEALKSFKEGLTVKLDYNVGQLTQSLSVNIATQSLRR